MQYKDILVVVDASFEAQNVLDNAFDLATRSDAHLGVIYPIQPMPDLPYIGMAADVSIFEDYIENEKQRATETHLKIKKQADLALLEFEWLERTGNPDQVVADLGKLFDLVVLGQDTQSDWPSALHGLSEGILLNIGGPALVIPAITTEPKDYKNILIAWDGSNSAARAVADAMPFLMNAETVEVTTIYNAKRDAADQSNHNEAMCRHLLRHGIGAKSTRIPHHSVDTGNTLLNHVSDTGAELLVMGAYGHSRFRETIMGGVTRTLLESMTVPLLLSH